MGVGGYGANNACDPHFSGMTSASGKYLYTTFPDAGEPGQGGIKAPTVFPNDCLTTDTRLITNATLSSSACQSAMDTACDEVSGPTPAIAAETSRSCIQSNSPNSYYHINWDVYAKRVECPTHMMEVTGCKLEPTNLPAANPAVTTAAQAQADSTFLSGYTTTTMQDCCKPTCAWKDNSSQGGTPVGNYNSFYTCDQTGAPVTDPQ